jgi:hypothetical protein
MKPPSKRAKALESKLHWEMVVRHQRAAKAALTSIVIDEAVMDRKAEYTPVIGSTPCPNEIGDGKEALNELPDEFRATNAR